MDSGDERRNDTCVDRRSHDTSACTQLRACPVRVLNGRFVLNRCFTAFDPLQTKTVPIMGDGRAGGGTEVPAASGDRGPI